MHADIWPNTAGTRVYRHTRRIVVLVPAVSGHTSDTSTLMLTVFVNIVNFGFILSVLDKEILVVTLSLMILVKMQGIVDEPEHVGKYIAHGFSVDCTRERTVEPH